MARGRGSGERQTGGSRIGGAERPGCYVTAMVR